MRSRTTSRKNQSTNSRLRSEARIEMVVEMWTLSGLLRIGTSDRLMWTWKGGLELIERWVAALGICVWTYRTFY
jgi:hypothetical protein